MDWSRYKGWNAESESVDYDRMVKRSLASDKPWHRDWADVKDAIYSIANDPPAYIKDPFTWSNYNYMQNSSNGCAAINCMRGLACLQEMQIRRGKKTNPTRYFEGWTYAVYHARIACDYGYGGCSISGTCEAINTFGLLPYEAVSRSTISDANMVNLGWNRRDGFNKAFEKYAALAELYQVVTTFPETFDDFLAVLDAGYPIEIGTKLKMTLDKKSGYYVAGGRTNHAMVALPPDNKDYRWGNSYGDNIANVSKDTLKKQFPYFKKYQSMLAMLNIET